MVQLFSRIRVKIRIVVAFMLGYNNEELPDVLSKLVLRKIKYSYALNLPFEKGRTVRGIGFTNEVKDLYSKVVSNLLVGKSVESVIDNLYASCQEYKDCSVFEFFDSLKEDKFKTIPLWAVVNPWETISLKESQQKYLKSFYVKRSEHNMHFTNSKDSYLESVIYSKESARSQVVQFQKLLKIIIDNGYIENPSDLPTAVVLVKNKNWRWIMGHSGNHRAHICKEIGNSYIRCKIVQVVEYGSLASCPNVMNSTYSLNQAEYFFDRVFEGQNAIRGPI